MKKLHRMTNMSRTKKIACTVSAAALMLGVSSAATVGLHFQDNYCSYTNYSGFLVNLTAFGIAPSGWENLLEVSSGYDDCKLTNAPYGYTLEEVIDTTTTTNGLNPLPNGSLNVTWWAPTANFTPFAGYVGTPPSYDDVGGEAFAQALHTNATSGEELVYASFLRDGINFGPPGGNNNDQPGYWVDITGLKSLFTNTPFVVELMASADSMETLTNAFVIDATGLTTNSVTYPSTPPVSDVGDAPWIRGAGGGLSTVSGVLNTDHIKIMSNQPQHGGSKLDGTGYNHAGTISGFILTDKPVVTMSPQTIPVAGPADTIVLNPYAIGVPPLAYQWRLNGHKITGATNLSYTIPSVNLASGGNYDLVVTNLYGAATSKVSVVTVDKIAQGPASEIVADSNPVNTEHAGVNTGATWQASGSDGTTTRTGVMDFNGADTNGITVLDSTAFDGTNGTITFWMQSAGADTTLVGSAIICRPTGTAGDDFLLWLAEGSPGNLNFQTPNATDNTFLSAVGVSDNKWHFVALTFDQTASGGVGLYIDGALDATNANSSPWSWPAGQPLEIGYSSDYATWGAYNGVLADVRYYSAVLTASQIAAIRTSGAVADTNDLQMWFNFTAAPGAGIVVTWLETSAVLQTAASVSGPWTDVTGAASPYTIVPSATQQFFRYRYVPQSLVSNPYLM